MKIPTLDSPKGVESRMGHPASSTPCKFHIFPALSLQENGETKDGEPRNCLLQGDQDLDYAVTGGEWFEGFAENGSDHFGFVGGFHGVAFFGGGDEEVSGLDGAVGGGYFAGNYADDVQRNIRLGSPIHGVGAGKDAGLGGIDSGGQRGLRLGGASEAAGGR